MNRVVEV